MIDNIKLISALDPTTYGGLLAFYRNKVSSFENERKEWIASIENLNGNLKVNHDREWQVFRLKSENEELQRKLTDLKLKHFQDRTMIIKLENDKLTLLESLQKEQKKVSELLAHVQPVQE